MNRIYFEAKGEALLEKIGMSKSEFARRMGIRKQNVKALFKSKNLDTMEAAGENMIAGIESVSETSVNPNIGSNIDISI